MIRIIRGWIAAYRKANHRSEPWPVKPDKDKG